MFLFNYIPLVGNMSSVLQTLLLAILILVKNQFKNGNGETSFFRFSLAVTKVLTDTYGLNC